MQGGKLRIRLQDSRRDRHAYTILADVLLLPVPKRELAETAIGDGFVRDSGYSIAAIDVEVADASVGKAVELRPTRLWLTNSEGLVRRVDFAERMAGVQAIWEAARGASNKVARLVREHEDAVTSADDLLIRMAATALRHAAGKRGDVLPRIAHALDVELGDAVPVGGTQVDAVFDGPVDDPTEPAEALRREITQYRRTAARGSAGRRFAEAVKAAYEYRCAFCGGDYPKLASAATSGVDGAHILPWARYDLNSVGNGLCLCKLCHWAFDNGLFRLDYRKTSKRYDLTIPKDTKKEAKSAAFDLSRFEDIAGPLAVWKLPSSSALWPTPAYLEELNATLYGM
jgi:hypothetical protein